MRMVMLISAALAAILSTVASSGQAPSTDLLGQARAAYDGRAGAASAKAAVELYAQAFKADPTSYDAAWEGSRGAVSPRSTARNRPARRPWRSISSPRP